MKGYNRRQHYNSGRAQRIAANRERKRQEREELRKAGIAEAKETLRLLNAYPSARIETEYCVIPNSTTKMIYEKYLKDNGEEI